MRAFKGKVALVTGGSAGLGAATALQFAREGAKVVIAARRVDQSEAVLKQIEGLGAEGLFVRTDVGNASDIQAMVQATVARFGRLDCAVNNAGIAGVLRTPIADVEEAQWDAVMNVNLKGVWLCMKHEIQAMLPHGAGAIVNVSSIYGLKGSDNGHAPYSTSKFGVVGLTRSAAIDYGQSGLRINAVAPGFTRSEMVNPDVPGAPERHRILAAKHSGMNRLGDAREIANAITWLCSDAARFVNGAVLNVDGGETSRLY
ncbi:MAG TPA: glucose 1-dehydrogenase [Burkholderiaceae bacterium]|jgi:NAD(P)-dependent dehydrogenase (short-subunit alcohol dehydrogenase family)